MNGHVGVVRLLLRSGADTSVSDSSGITLGHEAAQADQLEVCCVGCSAGPGSVWLHCWGCVRHVQAYRALQEFGYTITTDSPRDVVGRHPLHAAVLNNHDRFASTLLCEVSLPRRGFWTTARLRLGTHSSMLWVLVSVTMIRGWTPMSSMPMAAHRYTTRQRKCSTTAPHVPGCVLGPRLARRLLCTG